ncbi:MAG TPA: VOC family protein [Ktedonobacterales bacterium]|nr:VOC family protein [Ktedonobacterales bacterium]
MTTAQSYIRHGFGAVRPYLYGNTDLPEFVREVFGAEVVERAGYEDQSAHVEMRIGDSVLVIEAGGAHETMTRAAVYVYVPDVDATYQRALQLGATSVAEPADKPYLDRNAGVKDSFGNTWWIGTHIDGY